MEEKAASWPAGSSCSRWISPSGVAEGGGAAQAGPPPSAAARLACASACARVRPRGTRRTCTDLMRADLCFFFGLPSTGAAAVLCWGCWRTCTCTTRAAFLSPLPLPLAAAALCSPPSPRGRSADFRSLFWMRTLPCAPNCCRFGWNVSLGLLLHSRPSSSMTLTAGPRSRRSPYGCRSVSTDGRRGSAGLARWESNSRRAASFLFASSAFSCCCSAFLLFALSSSSWSFLAIRSRVSRSILSSSSLLRFSASLANSAMYSFCLATASSSSLSFSARAARTAACSEARFSRSSASLASCSALFSACAFMYSSRRRFSSASIRLCSSAIFLISSALLRLASSADLALLLSRLFSSSSLLFI
mmetsp:Transcript_13736/g.54358  ORF Transcript_13736/g.54358 Transcript_13736/m.54358 type:complete len:360 (-) Transcript_13736:800-1879(-)